MKQIRDRVGGLDVHRDSVVACCRTTEADRTVTVEKATFTTTRKGLRELAGFLRVAEVTTVAMESTGVYWRPVYYSLEGLFKEVWLCNAQHVKNVPGRKTDMNDAEWLADVAAHGMIRPSFVPPPEIRELREMTRYRKKLVDGRAHEIQRLERQLQDAGIKLTSVASRTLSVSSREMLEALIAGERDPKVLAQMARQKMRDKIPALEEALDGHFKAQHAFLCREILDHIDYLDASISRLTEEITERLVPFEGARQLLVSVPGISERTAEVIIAETGADMARFPTAAHLCAWAGVAPAANESAGKHKPAGSRRGDPWLRRTLIEAARAAARTKNSYYSARYVRLARRRGPNKALIALANSMLSDCWYLLSTGAVYEDPGADYYDKRHDPVVQAHLLRQRLERLGFKVTLERQAA